MSAYQAPSAGPYVLAVSISPGGIPKRPQPFASARKEGLVGDGRNHAKHIRFDRALSIWDYEILQQMIAEGFALSPGAAGENLTVLGLNVQQLAAGTMLKIGDVVARLEQPRKPCYVLDVIDPRLKDEIVGRCGYMASVLREGVIRPGMPIEVIMPTDIDLADDHLPAFENLPPQSGALAFHMTAGAAVAKTIWQPNPVDAIRSRSSR
jgi:MOSC domain-containing protein YiiM